MHSLDLHGPTTFWSYRRFIKGLIDAGVSPNEEARYCGLPLDTLICRRRIPCPVDEEFCKGVADISVDLIDVGATFSEPSMWCTDSLQNSLQVFKEIGERDGGIEGITNVLLNANKAMAG